MNSMLDSKDLHHLIDSLAANGVALHQVLSVTDPREMQWRPAEGKWNLIEILCHLRDEDQEDFGARVQQTLADPNVAPPAIDPEGWVVARNYKDADYAAVLEDFLKHRKAWVEWLRTQENAPWGNTWHHPRGGPLSSELFLRNWVAHDFLHLRQIIGLKYAYLQSISKGIDLGYAWAW